MPFRLKNAGATYQQLVDKDFDHQIGRNLEVYIDDLVIKSHSEKEVVRDIEKTFRTLRKIKMKLNPKKCTFGATKGMFLGYAISKDGIQAYSEKTQAVINMPSPRTLKEEAEKALKDMKKRMAELPTLTAPIKGETLIIALQSLEVNYTPMEKLILALVHAAKRLRRYFQAHPVAVEEAATTANQETTEVWKLFTDGSSNEGGYGAGLILTSPDSVELTYALRFKFKASNNEAEYEALLDGLIIVKSMGVKHVGAFVDSKLVANQINNLYQTKEETMELYLSKAKDLIAHFRSFSITQVPRSQNKDRGSENNRGRGRHMDDADKRIPGKWNSARREREATVVKGKDKAICDTRGNPIPEAIPQTMAPIDRDKSNAIGILLANNAHGRPNGDQSMSRVSSAQTHTASPKNKVKSNHISMVIPQMGDKYLWSIPQSSEQS
ncbi:reverse transcriptase domain-containing protein [Tanacetum coccineum]